MRKPKSLEKGTPPLTPTLNRKSERLEKHNSPNPVRRSDRGNKLFPSSPSISKKYEKGPSSPIESKKKKEKNLVDVTVESENAEPHVEMVGKKRKTRNAQSFMAWFKRQQIKIVIDGDGGRDESDKLSDGSSDNGGSIDREHSGNGEDICDGGSGRTVVGHTDNKIKKLNKQFRKRKRKFEQKHQEQLQGFQRNYEKEMSELLKDHKVKLTFNRSVYGHSSLGMNKLKVLNDDLARKISDLNIKKDVELKKLEEGRSADISEEEKKKAEWMAKAKAEEGTPKEIAVAGDTDNEIKKSKKKFRKRKLEQKRQEQNGHGEPAAEKLSTLLTEAEAIDTVIPVPSNHEAPVTDKFATPLLSSREATVTDKTISSLSSNRKAPLTENYTPRCGENSNVHSDHPNNTGPVSSAAQAQSVGLSVSSQNDMGIDPSVLLSHQPTPGIFQNELDNLSREAEQLDNNQKDMESQLIHDCDKEMQEAFAQIKKKYALKYQEGDAEYQSKKKELEKNRKKIRINEILAATFRKKCLGQPVARTSTFINPSIPTVRSPTITNQSTRSFAVSQNVTSARVKAMKNTTEPFLSTTPPAVEG